VQSKCGALLASQAGNASKENLRGDGKHGEHCCSDPVVLARALTPRYYLSVTIQALKNDSVQGLVIAAKLLTPIASRVDGDYAMRQTREMRP
jgi:hypothetical protein